MEEVTDFAFREMVARYSKPSLEDSHPGPLDGNLQGDFVMFTEFINVDGLTHPEGRKKLAIDLKYSEAQRPIVAQLWGRTPLKFEEAAKIIVDLGFDGIDINMGCPQQKEIRGGACAALIREPKLAREIISATKNGAGDLPISVKTRIGYSKSEEMGEWVETLLSTDIAALILHGRTKQEMSKVPAHWDKIAEAVEIRDEYFKSKNHVIARRSASDDEAILLKKKIASSADKALPPRNDNITLIIGNGDIKSREEGLQRVAETKVDGVMVGRGAFGYPWFFAQPNYNSNAGIRRSLLSDVALAKADGEGGLHDYQPDIKERFRVMLEHAELFQKELGEFKSFVIMRKHFKAYCSGFPGAHELRAKLMETKNLEDTRKIVEEFLRQHPEIENPQSTTA